MPSLCMNSYSDRPRTSWRRCVRTASEHTHASSSRGRIPVGQSRRLSAGTHNQGVWPVAPDVLFPVPWIGARQTAQREQPRHEAEIGLRFARLDELINLAQRGGMVPSLCRHYPPARDDARQRAGHVADGHKPANWSRGAAHCSKIKIDTPIFSAHHTRAKSLHATGNPRGWRTHARCSISRTWHGCSILRRRAEATARAASADRYEPLSVGAALHRSVRGPPIDQLIESGKGARYPLRRFPGSYPLAGAGD